VESAHMYWIFLEKEVLVVGAGKQNLHFVTVDANAKTYQYNSWILSLWNICHYVNETWSKINVTTGQFSNLLAFINPDVIVL
jgi:hypothetical protein